MARPRKTDDERRTEWIAFRVTPAERLRAEEKALAAGLPGAPEFARRLTLKGRVVVEQSRAMDPAVFDELRRIGVNINQLARKANQTGHLPPDLGKLAALIERWLIRNIASDGASASEPPMPPAQNAPKPEGPRGP